MAKSTSKQKNNFSAIVSIVLSKYFDFIGIKTKISKLFFGVWCGLWTFSIFMATGRQGADNPDSIFIMAGVYILLFSIWFIPTTIFFLIIKLIRKLMGRL